MIASALLGSSFSIRRRLIDTLFNVARLLAHLPNHSAGVGVKGTIAVYVTNVADSAANPLFKVNVRIAGNFAGQHDEVSLGKRLARHATQWILFEAGIENRITNGVANFIWMAFGDRLGRKNVTAGHDQTLKRGIVEALKRFLFTVSPTIQRFSAVDRHIDQS